MNRIAGPIGLFVVCLLASSSLAVADHIDGMTLSVSLAAAPGSVSLDWTGGQPMFSVYRSTNRLVVVDPGNLIGTSDVRTFGDAPPAGEAFFYEIASPCVYNPPEVCNGLDDDCDGTVDGPGSESSCNFPNATAACEGGTCTLLSCDPGYSMCGGASCDVSLLTDPQNCGVCGTLCASGSCAGGTCDVPVCTAGQRIWSTSVGGSAAGEPALSPDGATVYFMSDSTLVAMRERAEPGCSIGDCAAGGVKWTRTIGNVVAAPFALPDAVFASSTDGTLYKITVDGAVTSVNLQRTGCTSDALSASPVAQRYADSDSTFRTMADNAGHTGDDLVFVVTRYPASSPACVDGENRVYALWKSDLTVRWVYNHTGTTMALARGSGCALDTPTNTLVCGFETIPGSSQNTILALRTTTSLATGSARWARFTNAGVIGSPVIGVRPDSERRVYVSTGDDNLRAFALMDGSVSWTSGSPSLPGGILFDAVFSDYRLYVVGGDGYFRSIVDNGTYGSEDGAGLTADESGSVRFITRPLIEPSSGGVPGRAWIGRSDGSVQQIGAYRTLEGIVFVGSPYGGSVSGVVFESEPGVCTLDERLVATVPGRATEFAAPLSRSPVGE